MGTPPGPRLPAASDLAALLSRLEAQRQELLRAEEPVPPRSAWQRWGANALLLLLTVVSVYLTGGMALALGLLSILFAHEMGHYLACVRYRVDATLPYFIPAPLLSFVGTLGAFIKIRAPIPHRRALFDIGIAGPLAGFVVTLPVLVLGILDARLEPLDPRSGGIFLGEPLLFQWMARLLIGPTPDNVTLVLGPLGLAAWFGLFVTALNLLPIGQLDGGHVTYALFRDRAALISRLGFWACVALTYFGPNWLIWSLLLRLLGRRHPPTLDDRAPVGQGRRLVGLLGMLVFVVTFVPDPFQWSWIEFFEAIGLFAT
jgi:membrane-associated protease RseP (regulator of RpoE activity)